MFRNVLFMALLGLLPGCGENSKSGPSGAGGVGSQWYPGICVRTDTDGEPNFNPPRTERRTYTYNDVGQLMVYAFDDDAYYATVDRTTDYSVTFTYNADGTVTEYHDTGADGTVDNTTTNDPTDEGHQATDVCRRNPGKRIPYDGDYLTLTCDAHGRLVRIEPAGDEHNSGPVTTYTYDSNGRLLRDERVYEGEKWDSSLTTYTYEPDGTGWTSESDWGRDGSVNSRVTCTCGDCKWDHRF